MEEDAKRKSEEAARLAREAKLREKEKMQRVRDHLILNVQVGDSSALKETNWAVRSKRMTLRCVA